MLSQIYKPEQQVISEIETLELEARNIRQRIEHAQSDEDKRVLNQVLAEAECDIERLRERLE